MKKVILKLTLVAAFVVSAGYSVYTSQVNEDLSDLALANIEALAGGELPEIGVVCDYNPGRCWARRGPLCMKGEYTGPACVRTSNTSNFCNVCF